MSGGGKDLWHVGSVPPQYSQHMRLHTVLHTSFWPGLTCLREKGSAGSITAFTQPGVGIDRRESGLRHTCVTPHLHKALVRTSPRKTASKHCVTREQSSQLPLEALRVHGPRSTHQWPGHGCQSDLSLPGSGWSGTLAAVWAEGQMLNY